MRGYAGVTLRWCGGATALLLMVSVGAVLGQTPGQSVRRTFDAVSIKPNTSGSGNISVTQTRGQLMGTNIPVHTLIRMAYNVQEFQVVGPDWLATTKYDITARGENETGEPYRERLRNMLADRFQLVAKTGVREMPVYALVVDKPGTLGAQLKPTAIADCNAGQSCGTNINNRSVRTVSVSMASLARTLSPFTGRIVIDRTNLEGNYDATFTWTSDPRSAPAPGDDGPSIFTALQEQLGLKLDAQRGPVDVVVIERIERPTED